MLSFSFSLVFILGLAERNTAFLSFALYWAFNHLVWINFIRIVMGHKRGFDVELSNQFLAVQNVMCVESPGLYLTLSHRGNCSDILKLISDVSPNSATWMHLLNYFLVNTFPQWGDCPFHSCALSVTCTAHANTHIFSPDTSHVCCRTVSAGWVLIAVDREFTAAISFAVPGVWVLRLNLPHPESDWFSISLWTMNYLRLFCMHSSLSPSAHNLSWSSSSQMVAVHLPKPFAFAQTDCRIHTSAWIHCMFDVFDSPRAAWLAGLSVVSAAPQWAATASFEPVTVFFTLDVSLSYYYVCRFTLTYTFLWLYVLLVPLSARDSMITCSQIKLM